MSADLIIRFCAPTLAGLKAGSLFNYHYDEGENVEETIRKQNRLLNPKGVYFVLVRVRSGSALVYVYRKKQVEQILARPETQKFLREYGYTDFRLEPCLKRLMERLLMDEFPHDIGVFLDYPLADIQAFIANKGNNCCALGCWKVYTNVSEAEKKFRQFKTCTRIYHRCYFEGTDITRLTVAG